MQNIVWKLTLIVAVLGICLASLQFKELHLGTDLRGGVSLVYQVSIPEDAVAPGEVVTNTIEVLKERVNPKGILDIQMVPLGRDRIEVVMPLPNKVVQGLAREYGRALVSLLAASEIRAVELDDALRRGAAAAEIGGDATSERGQKALDLQTAYDSKVSANKAHKAAEAAGQDEEEITNLARAAALADLAYEALYGEVLGLSLGESRVRRVLSLPVIPQPVKNADSTPKIDENGDRVMGPSQRATAIASIEEEFPHLKDGLQATIAAYDAYDAERTGFDDPEDLIRLLRGAGVLEFRIAVAPGAPEGVDIADMRGQLIEIGPDNANSPVSRWYPINELKQWYDTPADLARLEDDPVTYFQSGRGLTCAVYDGDYYLLLYTTRPKSITHEADRTPWAITQAFLGQDQLGRSAINFTLDSPGGTQMSRLTSAHVRQPMAIVLDGEIFSAPSINSTISRSGQIVGSFSRDELDYLRRVLAAGSLQARLSPDPIAMSTIGPSIGQDNLESGRNAFIIAIIAVAVFMLIYYFFAGLVAVFALAANGLIIFGVMKGIDGSFTLPGLAGIVLTIGMAVDANVLIYERIREEIFAAEHDLRGAVRQGYNKALSTILDANITNLFVCFALMLTATTEVKGFALTLAIGICATLFTALFVTRQIYYLYTDFFKISQLSMLPTAFPSIHRMLVPSINWISFRKIFWTMSLIGVLGSGVLVWTRGVDMLDTEFRGGVALTMLTATIDEDLDGNPDVDEDGEKLRLLLLHAGPGGVEGRIRQLGRDAQAKLDASDPGGGTADETDRLRIRAQLATALVLTSGDVVNTDDGVQASAFQVKVASPKGLDAEATIIEVVVKAIVDELGSELDVIPELSYSGDNDNDAGQYVFPIRDNELGKNIGRDDATQRVPGFLGGVAIMLENVSPPVTEAELTKRIDRMRNQPDYARYSGRKVQVFGLTLAVENDRSKGYSDFAVVVYDEYRSILKVETEVWYTEVAEPEWELIGAALKKPTSLDQVSVYSSAVAETLAAQAIVAVCLTVLLIVVYIWVRFGSLRYSLAAIVALLHDVTLALGLLALSTILGGTSLGAMLLIEPFRIDLGVVAALLTIIGYSLNDTIVILDRIRENRGKLPLPTASIVNRSINETVSRTLLTSITTLLAVGIMYIAGGDGIRPFAFCLLVGLVVGTYSSVAIAAPLVYTGPADDRGADPEIANFRG